MIIVSIYSSPACADGELVNALRAAAADRRPRRVFLALLAQVGVAGEGGDLHPGEVLGVVKDFHFRSLKFDIRPILFIMDDHFYQNISIKLSNENLTETIANIEKSWQKASLKKISE